MRLTIILKSCTLHVIAALGQTLLTNLMHPFLFCSITLTVHPVHLSLLSFQSESAIISLILSLDLPKLYRDTLSETGMWSDAYTPCSMEII